MKRSRLPLTALRSFEAAGRLESVYPAGAAFAPADFGGAYPS